MSLSTNVSANLAVDVARWCLEADDTLAECTKLSVESIISLLQMQHFGPSEALSTDRHLEQPWGLLSHHDKFGNGGAASIYVLSTTTLL